MILPGGDISELFAHVTDHTAKLLLVADSDTENSMSLANMEELIKLAQLHDKERSQGNKVGSEERKKAFDAPSAQLTPLYKVNESDRQSTDAAKLFELLQPFLEKYLEKATKTSNTKTPLEHYLPRRRLHLATVSEDPFTSPGHRGGAESELDSGNNTQELRVDDTFDKPQRKSLLLLQLALLPVTTPPMSREFKEIKEFHSDETIAGGDNGEEGSEEEGEEETEEGTAGTGSDICRFFGKAPQVELADLTEDAIDMEAKKQSHAVPDMNKMVGELKLQLEQAKEQNREMVNEIGYLRDKLEQVEVEVKASKSGKESCPSSAGSTGSIPVNKETVEPCFRPYYLKLQLDKVDELCDIEKSNVIKNLMLSLLVSDFDHLQQMAPRVGDYLRISSRFLDKLHLRFYLCGEYCPSRYLRDYRLELMDDFQACLDGMMERVVMSEEPQKEACGHECCSGS